PHIEAVAGEDMPEPYRRLLVHDRDMTPTLEAFCGERIHLQLLARRLAEDAIYRQVVLMAGRDDTRPIEFGAIRINLSCFPEAAREQILEGYLPLGTILHEHGVVHHSRPNGYFVIQSDAVVRDAFGLQVDRKLFGRHNLIYDGEDDVMAEVVEILPPLQRHADSAGPPAPTGTPQEGGTP
ncbi:MAG: hypothetical protein OER86_04200, partial [Phycisphaerae bacterium]|nr:hypothetical protein [Phycisphaerae bacterium]